jgi:hypothetical protein
MVKVTAEAMGACQLAEDEAEVATSQIYGNQRTYSALRRNRQPS